VDAGHGELKQILQGHRRPVSSLALSSDGKTLFSGSWDKNIRQWNVDAGYGELDDLRITVLHPTPGLLKSTTISSWIATSTPILSAIGCIVCSTFPAARILQEFGALLVESSNHNAVADADGKKN
jgi:WD40 repeat protein